MRSAAESIKRMLSELSSSYAISHRISNFSYHQTSRIRQHHFASGERAAQECHSGGHDPGLGHAHHRGSVDRKSTRLNSSHLVISYAVFCLKKQTDNSGSSRRTSLRFAPAPGAAWAVVRAQKPSAVSPRVVAHAILTFFFKRAGAPALIPFPPGTDPAV